MEGSYERKSIQNYGKYRSRNPCDRYLHPCDRNRIRHSFNRKRSTIIKKQREPDYLGYSLFFYSPLYDANEIHSI